MNEEREWSRLPLIGCGFFQLKKFWEISGLSTNAVLQQAGQFVIFQFSQCGSCYSVVCHFNFNQYESFYSVLKM